MPRFTTTAMLASITMSTIFGLLCFTVLQFSGTKLSIDVKAGARGFELTTSVDRNVPQKFCVCPTSAESGERDS